MVKARVSVTPTPGVMVAYDARLINRVINRLCPPSDGDIILPQRRMMCIGTTSFEVEDVDYIPIIEEQVELMHRCAARAGPWCEEYQTARMVDVCQAAGGERRKRAQPGTNFQML